MKVRAEEIRKDFIRKSKDSNVFTAVKACSLTLQEGELAVVQGRSGSGKSTLMNMLSGILMPTGGNISYDDRDIYGMADPELSRFRNLHIGYVPQGKSAISSLTVYENILLPFTLYGENQEEEALRLMEQFQITHLKDAMPKELSGGELRRMAIARALIRRPEVLFADEPTGDLDDENTRIVFRALRGAADQGSCVFVVTHEGDAGDYADRIYRMDAGELYEQ